ncbi:MAG: autotransporter outer membrane beta-barrel domain-containing protein [Puniceicoccales bacterium]|nr:autotransporter outer membrane beta-barrel domain-containing protein [Puniceicoccales bacterium]
MFFADPLISASLSFTTETGDIILSGNRADTAAMGSGAENGSMIYAKGAESSIAFATTHGEIILSDNRPAVGSHVGGGAVYVETTVSSDFKITAGDGGASITDNRASREGGAIYIQSPDVTLTLDARAGDITFRGNRGNVTDFADGTDGTSDAIFVKTVTKNSADTASLVFAAGEGKTIAFYDNISANGTGHDVTLNHIDGTDTTGTVRFSGATAAIGGATTVHGGTFALADGAVYGDGATEGSSGTFTLEGNVTLEISGTGNQLQAAGGVTLGKGTVFVFDMADADADFAATPRLRITAGEIDGTGEAVLRNVGAMPNGVVYTLVDSGAVALPFDAAFTTDEGAFVARRGTGAAAGTAKALAVRLVADPAGGNLLQLATASPSALSGPLTNLVWAGTGAVGGNIWKSDNNTLSAANWNGSIAENGFSFPVTTFLDGDTVRFDGTATSTTVQVDDGGVSVSGVTITEGYTFGGGAVAVTGTLLKTGGDDVTFDSAFTASSLDVRDGKLALNGTGSITQSVSVTGGGTLAQGTGTQFGGGVALTLDAGTLRAPSGAVYSGGVWTADTNGGTFDIATGNATFSGTLNGTGTFTKTGEGRLTFSNAFAFAAFDGGVQINDGTLAYAGSTFDFRLSGTGTLAVNSAANGNFVFGTRATNSFTGTFRLESGSISLDNATNIAAIASATFALAPSSKAIVNGTGNVRLSALVLGGGRLVFTDTGASATAPLALGTLDVSAGGVVQLEFAPSIETTAAAGGNFFDLWRDPLNYQRQLIAASADFANGTPLSVRPLDTSATQTHALADGTGEARFDYTASVVPTGADAGLWLGYGLHDISANANQVVTLDATDVAEARLSVPLAGEGGFTFTGELAQTVTLGHPDSTYKGATLVDKIALTLGADAAFGAKAALTLTNGASVDSTYHAQAVTTLNLAEGTYFAAAALTVEQGGVVDGVVVAPVATVSGDVSGTGEWRVDDLTTSGTFVAAGVIGAVTNTGSFTVYSALSNGIRNDGAVATLRDVAGSISNRSGIVRLGSSAQWGALDNTRGFVDFVNAGRELRVASLSADPNTTGQMHLDINLLDFAQSDRLIVEGTITGRHEFVLTLADDCDRSAVTAESGNFPYITVGTHGSEVVTGVLRDIGAYDFVLTWDAAQSGYILKARDSYSLAAQAAINSIGAMSLAWFSQLDNLGKRLGDLRPEFVLRGPDDGFWVRTHAQQTNADLGIHGVGKFHEYQYGADVGGDRSIVLDDDDRLYLGGFAGYLSARRNFLGDTGGKGDTESVSAGAYAAWMQDDGWYFDGVLKGQYFDSDYDARDAHGEFKSYGVGVSFELGRQFSSANGTFIEPSLQFAYAHIFTEDFTTNTGLRVKSDDADIYRFAASVRVGKTLDFGDTGLLRPYAKAGIEHQAGGADVRLNGATFSPNSNGTRAQVGFGVSWQLDADSQIHFDYEAAFGEKYEKPWGINLGYHRRF